jgi:L-2-hydroxyglutarate oxidase LhgO
MDCIECVVIGAGVVGLAVARELALAGHEVVVVEAARAIASGTSARNSGVVHAGLYYPTGSLKARLCVEGRRSLYEFCDSRSVPYRRCGKLVVAAGIADEARLDAIAARAAANGVEGLARLTGEEARRLEPALHAQSALHSTVTGIVDVHALAHALLGDAEDHGAALVRSSRVVRGRVVRDGLELDVDDGAAAATRVHARRVVNAAGLDAAAVAARIEGVDPHAVPELHFARGTYFALAGPSPFTRLVYPVPEPGGLGVHLTLDLGGQARFGPDVEWLDEHDPARLEYTLDGGRANGFYHAIRRYWPGLPDGALRPAYAGIRPKLAAAGEPEADFRIDGEEVHGVAGLVNLFGIESPGLTASLALAREVRERLVRNG